MSGIAWVPRIGAEFAGYRLISLIGHGGMSIVYRAEHIGLGRTVALKLLSPQLSDDEDFRERFQRESRTAAALEHPNIIPIYEAGDEDGLFYIAMRYVEGADLKTKLKQEGPLDAGKVASLVSQVAAALEAAHEQGLIHRDVKPANILIAPGAGVEHSDHAYLSDFGIAKNTAAAGLTKTGLFVGTADYAAPEQIEGKPLDARADIYSLGCVAYEALTAAPAYDKDSEVAMMYAHLLEPPPKVSEKRPDLPPEVDDVIAKAVAKSRDDRYGRPTEFALALKQALGVASSPTVASGAPAAGETVLASAPATAPGPPAEEASAESQPTGGGGRSRRTRLVIALAGGVAAVLAAVLIPLVVLSGGGKSASSGTSPAATTSATTSGATSFQVPLSSSGEVPKLASSAMSGSASVTIDGAKICWRFRLSGVDNPTAAHIHRGGPAVSGPVVVPLGEEYSGNGCTTATSAAAAAILAHPADYYVNVHSAKYPDGAVRGQLKGTGTTTTAPVVTAAAHLLPVLIPTQIAKECKTRTTPDQGALETDVCVPPPTAPTSQPNLFQFSFYSSSQPLLQAYRRELKLAQGSLADCGSTPAGEEMWFHPTGKRGGRRFCFLDNRGRFVIVWTHEKLGDADHVDMLGLAREPGRAPTIFGHWWNAVNDLLGKCRPKVGQEACFATIKKITGRS